MCKLITVLFVAGCAFAAADNLTILPDNIELNGPEARHHLLAEANLGDHQEDWTSKVQWQSSNPKIAIVDANGEVRPMADGSATITATTQGRSATATVRIKGSQTPYTWSFRNDVIPVMTKVGCNQGACHGALAGKSGFKLT